MRSPKEMRPFAANDLVLILLAGGYGVWLLGFPNSVIRLHTWFHSGKVKMPSPLVIRIIGAVWLGLIAYLRIFRTKAGG